MQHLEDFSERVPLLPLVVNRFLRLIQELDRRAIRARDDMLHLQNLLKESLQGVELNNNNNYAFTEKQTEIIQQLDRAQTEYYHLSEEKYKISEQLEDEINIYHKELSEALKLYNDEQHNNNKNNNSNNNNSNNNNNIQEQKQSFQYCSPYKPSYNMGQISIDYKDRLQKE